MGRAITLAGLGLLCCLSAPLSAAASPVPTRPSRAHRGTPLAQRALRPSAAARREPRRPLPAAAHRGLPNGRLTRALHPLPKARAPEPRLRELARTPRRTTQHPYLLADARLFARTPPGPAPLRGSREVLLHQNLMADQAGLQRIQDDADLQRMRLAGELVDFLNSRTLQVNPDLPEDRRCARPWAVRFANDLARAFYQRFGHPLTITSAARSIDYQQHLQHTNGNAAGIEGDLASPHLTGQAIDFGKRDMSRPELAWMRAYLLPLMQAGKIDVEEEFKQACFHISVYRGYLPAAQRRDLAQFPGSAPRPSPTPAPEDEYPRLIP